MFDQLLINMFIKYIVSQRWINTATLEQLIHEMLVKAFIDIRDHTHRLYWCVDLSVEIKVRDQPTASFRLLEL